MSEVAITPVNRVVTTLPGSVDHARQHLMKKRRQEQAERADRHAADTQRVSLQLQLQASPIFQPTSGLWELIALSGSILMQSITQSARYSFEHLPADSRSSSAMSQLLLYKTTAMMSNKALGKMLASASSSLHAAQVAQFSLRGSAAILDSAGILWGGLLKAIRQKLEAGDFRAVIFIKKSRYDETPLKVRMSDAAASTTSSGEVSTHAKVMQTELALHFVIQDRATQRYWHLHGYVPTWLKIMGATTAENTKAAVLADQAQVPGLADLSKRFPWKLQLATVDRYRANLKAERSMHQDDISWTKFTKFCDVHIIAQVHAKTSAVLEGDVSGLLHTALAQYGAGTLAKLQQILRTIFEAETSVVYGLPPHGRAQRYRQEVHDLFLPVPLQPDLQSLSCRTLLRRYILASLLNGSLESDLIVHYCPFNCCKDFDDTISKLSIYATWALLPTKIPKFARNRWNNQEHSVAWAGLLASHHNLLQRVLVVFTGVPSPTPKKPPVSTRTGEAAGWDFLTDEDGVTPALEERGHLPDANAAVQIPDGGDDDGEEQGGVEGHSRGQMSLSDFRKEFGFCEDVLFLAIRVTLNIMTYVKQDSPSFNRGAALELLLLTIVKTQCGQLDEPARNSRQTVPLKNRILVEQVVEAVKMLIVPAQTVRQKRIGHAHSPSELCKEAYDVA